MYRAMLVFLLCLPLVSVFAQNDISLIPFEDETYSFQGVLPEGWAEISPGVYQNPAQPQMVVALQTAPETPDVILAALLPQLGLSHPPEPIETLESSQLTWTRYQVEVAIAGVTVDLGLAPVGNSTYIALLQAPNADYPALHESVFLPMMAALAPLTRPTDYQAEDITFPNGDVTLAGTISIPEGDAPFPAIVLISGSGKQDRDESLAPVADIKPFRLLADYLTTQGYVVLRYDDRGIGGSTGEIDSTLQENASDAAAAIDYLLTRSEVNAAQIGVLGHSEGGAIAALLGAENPHVAFIISMAGSSVNGKEILYVQNARLLAVEGATQAQIDRQIAFLDRLFAAIDGEDKNEIEQAIQAQIQGAIADLTKEEQAALGDLDLYIQTQTQSFVAQYDTAWFRSFLAYDPALDWAKVSVPVLALFGELDVQVDAEQNTVALENTLKTGNHPDYTIITLEGANHLFQAAETGAVSEYGALEATFTPAFLPTIGAWLAQRFGDQ